MVAWPVRSRQSARCRWRVTISEYSAVMAMMLRIIGGMSARCAAKPPSIAAASGLFGTDFAPQDMIGKNDGGKPVFQITRRGPVGVASPQHRRQADVNQDPVEGAVGQVEQPQPATAGRGIPGSAACRATCYLLARTL